MTTKPLFSALGAPMSPARVHGSPHVEELALPKSKLQIPPRQSGHSVDVGIYLI
jgi:hypothetical protein